ncbi:MAG: hypothetical protein MGG11_11655 [Trichodesmium sp. MAG_R03]|nr:hypothetical protein [Trichodesmium sp. MAG_R03]
MECILDDHLNSDRQAYSTVVDSFKLAEVIKAKNPVFFEKEYIPAGCKRISVKEKLSENDSSAKK